MCNPDLNTENQVLLGIKEFTGESVNFDTKVFEKLDSLEFAGLVFDLEVCFDIVIDLDKMKSDMTVAQLIELIEYHRKNRNHVEV